MTQDRPSRRAVVTALGIVQILAWGTSFYIPAVLAGPIVAETGWSLGWVVGGASLGLFTAGLISPQVGRIIDRRGGRPVLAASSLLFAAGLTGIGLAPSLPVYLTAWVILGIGMGCGLYDAVFAALGRLYGHAARAPITNLTLFGGFASTVCWPLSAALAQAFGWRGACLIYAALHLAVALPLQLYAMRGSSPRPERGAGAPAGDRAATEAAAIPREGVVFAVLATVMTLAAGIGSIVVVHLMIFLQGRGVDYAAAVALGTLFGPAQVGARAVERLVGAHYHPVWTMIAACALMAIGLGLLMAGSAPLAVVIVIYAAGYGVSWIARGTVPLALFGQARYAPLMGKLALPSLIVQAVAPSAGALLIDAFGAEAMIATLTGCAGLNVALAWMLWAARPPKAPFADAEA